MEEKNINSQCSCCCSKKKGTAFSIIGIILLAGIVTVAILRDRIVSQPQNQVSIVGQGKIAYQPDLANVTLGVQIDKVATATAALNQLNDRVKKITEALKALGLPEENIKTQNYSLLPQYDYADNASKLAGYNANQQLVVKVSDIKNNPDKLNQVVSKASEAGANQVLGISYNVSNLEDLKQQARVLAISDAKNKAEALASTAGVSLREIVGWYENFIVPVMDNYYAGGMGGGGAYSPTLPNGNQEIVMELSLSYKLK